MFSSRAGVGLSSASSDRQAPLPATTPRTSPGALTVQGHGRVAMPTYRLGQSPSFSRWRPVTLPTSALPSGLRLAAAPVLWSRVIGILLAPLRPPPNLPIFSHRCPPRAVWEGALLWQWSTSPFWPCRRAVLPVTVSLERHLRETVETSHAVRFPPFWVVVGLAMGVPPVWRKRCGLMVAHARPPL